MTDEEHIENIRTWIKDGDKVRSRISRDYCGTAFIRNNKGQWLVRWDHAADGLDIVHSDFLERDI